MKSLIEKNSWSGIEDYFHHLGRGQGSGQGHRQGRGMAGCRHTGSSLVSAERELAKAEKLSLEEGGKDARGLLSGLRRRKRPLSWRGHGDGPQHPDPDPCTRVGMHPSGEFRQAWGGGGGGGAGDLGGVSPSIWVGMSLSDSELLPRRLPQLPLLRTIRGPGPRGRHPQRPVSHQHCVSKGAGLGGQTGLDLHPGCVSLGKCLASLGLCLRESTGSPPHSKD